MKPKVKGDRVFSGDWREQLFRRFGNANSYMEGYYFVNSVPHFL